LGDGVHLRVIDAYADWESVNRDNVGRLYRPMNARVWNRPDAEDLTSEVFRTAPGPLRLVSSKGEVRSYLLVTARTVLASHWRWCTGELPRD
jgi:RNA polymerase sigma-70 factor (ECF subfamily)